MSHLKERKEKNCLNCNALVYGKYCHICGQENIEPKESVLHLVNHFFQDITHFDGKFFSSLKLLITRPGFLSRQYALGRRASYLNPIRMYIFTSAIFFLIFFSFFKLDKEKIVSGATMNGKTMVEIMAMDTLHFNLFTSKINKADGKDSVPMTKEQFQHYFDSTLKQADIITSSYKSVKQYDSLVKAGVKEDSWIQRKLVIKEMEIREKFKNRPGESVNAFIEILLHSLPQMFFISLPLFALLLKILYARRKQFYYVNHGIFSIHFYIFVFIAMLALFSLAEANAYLHWKFITIIEVLIGIGMAFYLYKAMRNFYQQRRAKTIMKFLLLCFLLFIVLGLLFVIFAFFSLFKL